MNSKQIAVFLLLCLLITVPRSGMSANGVIQYEVPFNTTLYVPCLGEEVEIDLLATVRSHLVESGNGGFHYIENWFMVGEAEGLDSGYKWYAHGASPFLVNASAAEVNKLVINLVYEPLDGGRKFMEKAHFQLVADSNGVLRNIKDSTQLRCVGR